MNHSCTGRESVLNFSLGFDICFSLWMEPIYLIFQYIKVLSGTFFSAWILIRGPSPSDPMELGDKLSEFGCCSLNKGYKSKTEVWEKTKNSPLSAAHGLLSCTVSEKSPTTASPKRKSYYVCMNIPYHFTNYVSLLK